MTDIDAIRQREQAADSGPWRVVEEHGRDIADEAYTRLTIQTANGESREVAEMVDPDHSWASKLTEENAAFIAHARTDIPALLTALKAKLNLPCGSCHPCTNYADETWRAAGRKPPHVFEYDELLAEVKALRPVADAAAAWRRFTGDDSVRFSEETALIAAVDALPNLQEPCDICSSTAGGCPECKTDTTREGA